MEKMIEINVTVPLRLTLLLPQPLFDELGSRVNQDNIDAIFTEAIREELKKLRFRNALRSAIQK